MKVMSLRSLASQNLEKTLEIQFVSLIRKLGVWGPLGLPVLNEQNTARSSGIGKVEKYPKGQNPDIRPDGFFKEVEIYAKCSVSKQDHRNINSFDQVMRLRCLFVSRAQFLLLFGEAAMLQLLEVLCCMTKILKLINWILCGSIKLILVEYWDAV